MTLFNPHLQIGQEISNADLSTIFQCGNMGDMRRSNTTNTLVLVADYTKGLYHNKWIGGVLHYTGMGKNGDQNIRSGQNDTLANCATNGVDVHLFEVMYEGRYTYCGRIELVDKPYTETQPGEDGIDRLVWIFPIRPVPDNDVKKPSMCVFKDMEDYQKNGKNMTKKIECVNLEGRDKLLQELQTLSQELYDMREDDRDCHNQILQVFSVTGTVLTVFFGGGFFFESNGSGNSVVKEQSLFQGEIGHSIWRFCSLGG